MLKRFRLQKPAHSRYSRELVTNYGIYIYDLKKDEATRIRAFRKLSLPAFYKPDKISSTHLIPHAYPAEQRGEDGFPSLSLPIIFPGPTYYTRRNVLKSLHLSRSHVGSQNPNAHFKEIIRVWKLTRFEQIIKIWNWQTVTVCVKMSKTEV